MSRSKLAPRKRVISHFSTTELQFQSLEERRLLSASPEFLGDLGTALPIKPGNEFVDVGGTVYFTGQISTVGDVELWKTDGTAAGTVPVKDLNVSDPSKITNLTNFADALYFLGDDQRGGRGLWKSDGTAAGTELVKQLSLPSTNIGRAMVRAGGTLYFVARSSTSLIDELWKSDGTAAGTVKLATLGYGLTSRFGLVAAGDSIFFEANTEELWTSDGTALGTKLLRKFSSLNLPVAIGDDVYFSAFLPGSTTGIELWKSNGTTAGTVEVKDIYLGAGHSSPQRLFAEGSVLYFSAFDAAHGEELWRSDGTGAGTYLVRDINPGTASSSPRAFATVGGDTYFTAQATGPSRALWKTDGTELGTMPVVDQVFGNQPAELDGVLFNLDPAGALWRYDPLVGIAEQVAAGPFQSVVARDGKLYLQQGDRLAISTGTADGTIYVDRPNRRLTHSNASGFVDLNGVTYFSAADDAGTELWRDDGIGGVVRVADLNPGPGGSYPRHLRAFAGALYFFAADGTGERHLWRSDGTEAGTELAMDMTDIGREVAGVEVNDDVMYFVMWNDGSHRIWRTDGTQDGTINLAPNATYIKHTGEALFFNSGTSLWTSDGTVEGTVFIKDIRDGSQIAWIDEIKSLGGRAYFIARNDDYGRELWTSDGTEQGTHPVEDVTPGAGSSTFVPWISNNKMYLAGNANGTNGLWTLNADGDDIQLVQEFDSIGSSYYGTLEDILYFSASSADGDGLWRSDGTTAGTWFVKSVGAISSYSWFATGGRWIYFAADDGTHGMEVWRTDGTADGTELVADLWPGSQGSEPWLSSTSGGNVYLVANDGQTGFDPWVIRAPQVVGQYLFYNESAFDGGSAAIDDLDDVAIATDKVAYKSGDGTATSANVSSYSRGINGLMIDIKGLESGLSASDFEFRVGTSNAPDTWAAAPAPVAITIRGTAGVGGADRVEIVWSDGAIKNTWLQVIVKGNDALGGFNANTGLLASNVFFFGSRVGDTFENSPPGFAITNVWDDIKVRSSGGSNQPITSPYDFNRDGLVNVADQIIARSNIGTLPLLDLAGTVAAQFVQPQVTLDDRRAAVAFALAATATSAEGDLEPWWRGVSFD